MRGVRSASVSVNKTLGGSCWGFVVGVSVVAGALEGLAAIFDDGFVRLRFLYSRKDI